MADPVGIGFTRYATARPAGGGDGEHNGTGPNSTAVGTAATASDDSTTSLGDNATASAWGAIAIGANAVAGIDYGSANAIAIGESTRVGSDSSIAIGASIDLSGTGAYLATFIGSYVSSGTIGPQDQQVGIGAYARVKSRRATAIGSLVTVDSNAEYAVCVGDVAGCYDGAHRSVAVGANSYCGAPYAVAIGNDAGVGSLHGTAIGAESYVSNVDGVCVGYKSRAQGLRTWAIGANARTENGRGYSAADGASPVTQDRGILQADVVEIVPSSVQDQEFPAATDTWAAKATGLIVRDDNGVRYKLSANTDGTLSWGLY